MAALIANYARISCDRKFSVAMFVLLSNYPSLNFASARNAAETYTFGNVAMRNSETWLFSFA